MKDEVDFEVEYMKLLKDTEAVQEILTDLLKSRQETDRSIKAMVKELSRIQQTADKLHTDVNLSIKSNTHEGSLTAKLLALKEGDTIILLDTPNAQSGRPTLMERSVGSVLSKSSILKARNIRTERWTGFKNAGRCPSSNLLAIIREKDNHEKDDTENRPEFAPDGRD